MKYFIVGKHASGKMKVANILISNGISVGHLSTNADLTDDITQHNFYKKYTIGDMNSIFENNAYIFFHDINNNMMNDYECLTKYDFDNHDVFVLSPHQINSIPNVNLNERVCFVWLDNNLSNREIVHIDENRKYSFVEREQFESIDTYDFINKIYNLPNSNMIYFWNEEPQRIACILHAMIKHTDLEELFIKNFK